MAILVLAYSRKDTAAGIPSVVTFMSCDARSGP